MAEVRALEQVIQALKGLDDQAVRRIVRWLSDRFDDRPLAASPQAEPAARPRGPAPQNEAVLRAASRLTLAQFFSQANPQRDPDRALVVAYWLQVIEGRHDLEAQGVNRRLKELGHRVSNITRALGALAQASPKLLVQTGKRGATKQGRKRYTVTTAGVDWVESRPGVRDHIVGGAGYPPALPSPLPEGSTR